jgi:large subunit ribosomal protein L24
MALKIKRGDTVVVISGKEKGKHARPSQNNQQGLFTFDAPIHISNVMLVDPDSGEPTKVGYRFTDSGEKVRVSRKTGKDIDG